MVLVQLVRAGPSFDRFDRGGMDARLRVQDCDRIALAFGAWFTDELGEPQDFSGATTLASGAVVPEPATLALVALVYLGYDLAKGRLSPCDAIFQESSLGLSTRISFLKTEGVL